ncbi:hypothetical protein BASH2_00760 [Bacillus anthracis]|nr:hypothetical protein BASH2_00760 [Bacillus anthracis]
MISQTTKKVTIFSQMYISISFSPFYDTPFFLFI